MCVCVCVCLLVAVTISLALLPCFDMEKASTKSAVAASNLTLHQATIFWYTHQLCSIITQLLALQLKSTRNSLQIGLGDDIAMKKKPVSLHITHNRLHYKTELFSSNFWS